MLLCQSSFLLFSVPTRSLIATLSTVNRQQVFAFNPLHIRILWMEALGTQTHTQQSSRVVIATNDITFRETREDGGHGRVAGVIALLMSNFDAGTLGCKMLGCLLALFARTFPCFTERTTKSRDTCMEWSCNANSSENWRFRMLRMLKKIPSMVAITSFHLAQHLAVVP